MSRIALILLVILSAGCRETSLAPAVSPEALRQKATACRAEGKQPEAEALLVQAVALQQTKTRDERSAAADLRRELASLRMAADDLAGAEKLYREALALLEEWPRGADAAIINLRTQLAGLCYRQSRLDEAAEFYRSVLSLEVASLGEGHPDPLGTMSILGGLELKRGKPAKAEALFRRQLTGVQKLHGAEKRESASVLDNLAEAVDKQGQAAEATRLREEAKRIRHKLCDEC
ncbi:MAG: tetratricopeptide repeat protein [Verrucomicrobia bacterium]|nr:tetratricopeptide repeat protein [Verrucomicrobiota bacterium]